MSKQNSDNLDCSTLVNQDQCDALAVFLRGNTIDGVLLEEVLIKATNKFAQVLTKHHARVARLTETFISMRYAAPTPASMNRLMKTMLTRFQSCRREGYRDFGSGPLDAAYVELRDALAPLSSQPDKSGHIHGPFERIARASSMEYLSFYMSSASRSKPIKLLEITVLVVKGIRHARLVGRLDPAFAGRVSCTFARWSMGASLDPTTLAQKDNGWFGDGKLCDAIQQPRDGRLRLQSLFQGPLAQGAVMLVAVTDPNWVRFAREHDMFCGDAFAAGGLDASAGFSLDKIASQRKPASGGIDGALALLKVRYPPVADLFVAMDAFGLVKPMTPRSAKSPRYEWSQLKTALNVLDHIRDGVTELAKSVEVVVFTPDGRVYGNEHSFDNVLKWDRNWPLATKLEGLLGRSIDTFALAPLEQGGAIVDKGSRAGCFYPLDALATSPGGRTSLKRRRDAVDGVVKPAFRCKNGHRFESAAKRPSCTVCRSEDCKPVA